MTNANARLKKMTEAEEADIQNQIADDPDDHDATDEDLEQAKPFADALPELAATIRRGPGRPSVDNPKQAVTLRLEPKVVEHFKAGGRKWRADMADALRKAANED